MDPFRQAMAGKPIGDGSGRMNRRLELTGEAEDPQRQMVVGIAEAGERILEALVQSKPRQHRRRHKQGQPSLQP